MTSNQNADIIRTGIEVDQATTRRAQKAIADFAKSQKQIEDSAKRANKELAATDKALEKIARQRALDSLARDAVDSGKSVKDLRSEFEKIGATEAEIGKVAREIDKITAANERAAKSAREISRFEQGDTFNSRARERVGSLGDVDTVAQLTGGAARSAGLEGLGTGLQVAGEVTALSEGIGQLAGAVPAAIAALGPLAPIIAGLGVVAAAAAVEIVKGRKALENQVAAQREFNRFRIDATTEEATAQLEELRKQLRASQRTYNELAAAGENVDGVLGELVKAAGGYDAALKQLGDEQISISNEINLYNRALLDGEFAANDAAEQEIKLADARLQATEAGIEAQRQLFEQLSNPDFGIDEYNSLYQSLERQRASLQRVADDTDLSAEAQRSYAEQIETINKQLQVLNTEGYETARSNELLTRSLQDLRQAEIDRQSAIDAGIEAQRRFALEIANPNFDTEAFAARVNALQLEKKALEDAIQSQGLSEDALKTYEKQLADVNRELGLFNATAFKRAAQNTRRQQEERAREEELKKAEDIAKKITDIRQGIVDIEQKSAQRVKEIRAQLAQDEQKLARDRDRDLREAAIEAGQEREDAALEASRQIADLETDLAKRRRDIIKRANVDIADAVANRDAVALQSAKDRRDKELDDLKDEEQTRRAEIQRELRRQTEDIKRNLNRQRQLINEQYKQQLQDTRKAAEIAIRMEREKARAEIAVRQQALRAEISAMKSLSSAAQSFARSLISAANAISRTRISTPTQQQTVKNVTQQTAAQATTASTTIGKTIGSGLSNIFRRADSGLVLDSDGLVFARQGEAVLRQRQIGQLLNAAGRGGLSPSFNFNISGMTASQVRKEARRQFEQGLEEFIVAAELR